MCDQPPSREYDAELSGSSVVECETALHGILNGVNLCDFLQCCEYDSRRVKIVMEEEYDKLTLAELVQFTIHASVTNSRSHLVVVGLYEIDRRMRSDLGIDECLLHRYGLPFWLRRLQRIVASNSDDVGSVHTYIKHRCNRLLRALSNEDVN